MGDMADYYREQSFGYYEAHWPFDPPDGVEFDVYEVEPNPTRETYWRTREGREVKVRDLEAGHLRNILKMWLDGRLIMPRAWTTLLGQELATRELEHDDQ